MPRDGHIGSALGKAVLVLETVIDRPGPVSIGALAMWLGLPKQTVHRIVHQLVDEGLLCKSMSGEGYTVAPRLSRLGRRIHELNRVVMGENLDSVYAQQRVPCANASLEGPAVRCDGQNDHLPIVVTGTARDANFLVFARPADCESDDARAREHIAMEQRMPVALCRRARRTFWPFIFSLLSLFRDSCHLACHRSCHHTY